MIKYKKHKFFKKILIFAIIPAISIGLMGYGIISLNKKSHPLINNAVQSMTISAPATITEETANFPSITNISYHTIPENSIPSTIDWVLEDSNGEKIPNSEIFVNNNFQIIISKNIDLAKYNKKTITLYANFTSTVYSETANPPKTNKISITLNITQSSSSVAYIEWVKNGTTDATVDISQIDDISLTKLPWKAEAIYTDSTIKNNGVQYEIEPINFDNTKQVFTVSNGYVYFYSNDTSKPSYNAVSGETYNFKIKAYATDDNNKNLLSSQISITTIPSQEQIASLEFVDMTSTALVNLNSDWTSQKPCVVIAKDKNGVIIPNPQVDFSFVLNKATADVNCSLDDENFLHIDASQVNNFTSLTSTVTAVSHLNQAIKKIFILNISIFDLQTQYFSFDFKTGTITGMTSYGEKHYSQRQGLLNDLDGLTFKDLDNPDDKNTKPIIAFGDNIFNDYQKSIIKQIILPSTLTSIGTNFLAGAPNLSEIVVNSNPTLSANCFSTLRNTTLTINNQAFVDSLNNNAEKYFPATTDVSNYISTYSQTFPAYGGEFWDHNMSYAYPEKTYQALNNNYENIFKQNNIIFNNSTNLNAFTKITLSGSISIPYKLQEKIDNTVQSYSLPQYDNEKPVFDYFHIYTTTIFYSCSCWQDRGINFQADKYQYFAFKVNLYSFSTRDDSIKFSLPNLNQVFSQHFNNRYFKTTNFLGQYCEIFSSTDNYYNPFFYDCLHYGNNNSCSCFTSVDWVLNHTQIPFNEAFCGYDERLQGS